VTGKTRRRRAGDAEERRARLYARRLSKALGTPHRKYVRRLAFERALREYREVIPPEDRRGVVKREVECKASGLRKLGSLSPVQGVIGDSRHLESEVNQEPDATPPEVKSAFLQRGVGGQPP
jgi:hypothetical protein